ncbi:MAG: amidase [Pirellulaceae bacterium]|nr:amidase [Pirellulaceae bacterium]MDP6556921.1 amidase [Pirellulaceae bacterium]MDP6721332.1 amidase [Pirellulaceae bacterium]
MSKTADNCLEIAAKVQSHEKTARQIADEALAKAQRLQEKWRPFIRITPELAWQQAERVDRQVASGRQLPLAGVPFAVKDLINMKDVPTTCGSKVFRDHVAGADATVVQKLIASGAVPLGKLNMHECAFGFTGENPTFGDCRNPWDANRIAGGSSSGSAVAVALGICPVTLGSDTGGSVRLPAALCGLTGLKPTYGRVSRHGVVPLAWSMDHVGPLTRTAEDAALVLEQMAGHDPADGSSSRQRVPQYQDDLEKPLRGLRIGLPQTWFFEALDPEVSQAVEVGIDRLVSLGCERIDVILPHLAEVLGAHRAIIFSEASSYHQPFLAERADRYGDDIRPLLQGGLLLPAVDYLKGQRVRRVVGKAWANVFASIDCLLTPTTPIVATRFGQRTAALPGGERQLVRAYLDFSLPFNLTGHPALSIPCGFSKEGLPIGVHLVGGPFEEGTILRIAHQYQRQTDWHQRTAPANHLTTTELPNT